MFPASTRIGGPGVPGISEKRARCSVPPPPAALSDDPPDPDHSQNITFNLYCATNPSIEDSSALTFKPFACAYPNLAAHFAAAELDPAADKWSAVYDFNGEDPNSEGNYTVETPDSVEYLEIPSKASAPARTPWPSPAGRRTPPARTPVPPP